MAKGKPLELLIRIGGRMDKSLAAAISAAQGQVSGFARTLDRMGTAGLTAMGTLAAGTTAALISCTQEAAKFKNGMGDVAKYVNGIADASGNIDTEKYGEMSKAIRDLSTQIPYTQEELQRLAAAAGQSGKSMKDLFQYDNRGSVSGFLKDVAVMGTAWDISADQAGDWAAKWEVALNMNHGQVMDLADQINYLGANNATTAAEIGSVVNKVASFGKVAGMEADQTAALSAALLAMGVSEDVAASSINRMYTNLNKGASATAAQKKMWASMGMNAEDVARGMQENAAETMKAVFTAVGRMPEESRVAALSTLLGQWAIQAGGKLTTNLDAFIKTLDQVEDKAAWDNSMTREFIIKADTPEAISTMLGSSAAAFKGEVGESFLPVQKEISKLVIDAMNGLRGYMPQISQITGNMARALSEGAEKLGQKLERAKPYIQDALDYLVNHGPEVVRVLKGMAGAFAAMKLAPGLEALLGGAGRMLLGTRQVRGGRKGGLLGMFRDGQALGGRMMGTASGVLGTIRDIAGTAKADSALSGTGFIRTLLGTVKMSALGGASRALGRVSNSGPGRYVGGIWAALKNVGGVLGAEAGNRDVYGSVGSALGSLGRIGKAGFGVLGSALGAPLSGFGGLFMGALPIVGAISGVIAVVSILGDHLDGVRDIIGNTFGPGGLAVFDGFMAKAGEVGRFITGLFQEGGVAKALAPLQEMITGMFGDDAGAAFGGLIQILQSVMGVIGQVVTFANTTVKPIIEQIFGFITGTVVPIILQTFTAAAPIISGIISNLGSAVMSGMQLIGMAVQTVLPIVQGLVELILNLGSAVLPAVLEGIRQFSQGISTTLGGIIDFITGVFTGNWSLAWQGVQDIFKGVFEALAGLIKTPINAVINLINKAISGINGLGLTIPDWVPFIGGKSFSINIPEIPMLAKGGFTSGPSIAGEAGREAVISFLPNQRARNLDIWRQAGQLLGARELEELPEGADGGPGGQAVFSPKIIIQGNADRAVIDEALQAAFERFQAWYSQMQRDRARRAY